MASKVVFDGTPLFLPPPPPLALSKARASTRRSIMNRQAGHRGSDLMGRRLARPTTPGRTLDQPHEQNSFFPNQHDQQDTQPNADADGDAPAATAAHHHQSVDRWDVVAACMLYAECSVRWQLQMYTLTPQTPTHTPLKQPSNALTHHSHTTRTPLMP